MRRGIELPLTIEGQLERYAQAEGHNDRHNILWYTWLQNKRWISQLLEGTATTFPNYSRHDASHAQTVLHNIELILGEDRIDKLSATDCFVLLHTVYIHDIGMTITAAEREEIVTNEKFVKMVDFLELEGDTNLQKAVAALKKTDYSNDELDSFETQKKLYKAKLDVYNGLIHLISSYRRSEHGEKSRDSLYQWTKEPGKLGGGFSLAGMPQRIFLTIAECAEMHTRPDFDSIFRLAQEDDGYVFDYMHPRFVSLLLQLGDILDIDNDRFHPLAMMGIDDIPVLSQIHYKKHLAIRRLHIRPDIIEIAADCESQDALRQVRKECDMLKEILQQAGYAWSSICPAGFPGALPIIKNVSLKLCGRDIPQNFIMMQFHIPQKRAFEILEGSNVYKNRFAFLREFLQNAVDATKKQYWKECIGMAEFYKKGGLQNTKSPYDFEEIVSTAKFPIEIEMEICKRDNQYLLKPFNKEDLLQMDKGQKPDYTLGVNVKIKDFGIGIGKEDLYRISQVGISIDKRRWEMREIPEWLRPTAEFGIGLQSAFLVARTFKCYTHTRKEERYEITFGSGALAEYEGYINVRPIVKGESKDDTYGTCFEIFVSEDKKMLHEESPESWDGEDMFSDEYENRRSLRHAAELISQMTLYLDALLGETSVFPIHLKIIEPVGVKIPVDVMRKNRIHALKLDKQDVEEKNGGV